MTETVLRHVGPSIDRRTNVWEVTPDCGHKPFKPPTTMLAHQIVECPRCGKQWRADYNAQTLSEIDHE